MTTDQPNPPGCICEYVHPSCSYCPVTTDREADEALAKALGLSERGGPALTVRLRAAGWAPSVPVSADVRHCGRIDSAPHPPHAWMTGIAGYRCPGIPDPVPVSADREAEAYQRGYDAGVEALDVEDLTAEAKALRAAVAAVARLCEEGLRRHRDDNGGCSWCEGGPWPCPDAAAYSAIRAALPAQGEKRDGAAAQIERIRKIVDEYDEFWSEAPEDGWRFHRDLRAALCRCSRPPQGGEHHSVPCPLFGIDLPALPPQEEQ